MANGINKVILVGHLGADPEVRHLENGTPLARVSLATTETYKDRDGNKKDQTEWHTVLFWRKIAEVVEKYVKKGDLLYVEGKIRTRKWEDKDGNTRYSTEVHADNMTMLGGKPKGDNAASSQSQTANVAEPQENVDNTPPADDDLPF